MKIALVWPFGYDTEYVMPLSLGYLKNNLDETKHNVKIFDCSLKPLKAENNLNVKNVANAS